MNRRVRILYIGDSALARECFERPGGPIDILEAAGIAAEPSPGTGAPPPADIVFIEHHPPRRDALAILRDIAARQLHLPAVIVAEWNEDLALLTLKLGAIDYIVKSRPSFRAALFRLNRLTAFSALRREHASLRQAHAQAVRAREADAAAVAERYVRRESDLTARLAEAGARHETLEREIAALNQAIRRAEEQAKAQQQTAADDFTRRRMELEAALADEAARRRTLETKLAEAEAMRQLTEQLQLAEATAFAEVRAQEEAEFTARLDEALRARNALQQQLAEALQAIEQAGQDRAAAAAASSGHLAQREAAFASQIAVASGIQQRLERELAEAHAAIDDARQEAAAERESTRQVAAEQQASAEAASARADAEREALERQLADATTALQHARSEHAAAAVVFEAQLAEQQTQYEGRLTRSATTLDAARAELATAETALRHAERQHASAMSDAAARLDVSEARLEQALAAATTLARELAGTASALERAERQAEADRRSGAAQAAERQAEFDAALEHELAVRRGVEEQLAAANAERDLAAQRELKVGATLARETAARQAIEAKLAETVAALRSVEHRYAAEISAAAARLAEHQQDADERLAEAVAAAKGLQTRLSDAAEALERAEQLAEADRRSAAAQTAERQAEFDAALSREAGARQSLEKQLADAHEAREHAGQRHASELAAAAVLLTDHQHQAGQREEGFVAMLAQERSAREAVEAKLSNATAALHTAVEQHAAEMAAAAARLAEHQQQADDRLAEALAEASTLEARLADARAALERAQAQADADRREAAEAIAQRQAAFDATLSREQGDAAAAHQRIIEQHQSEIADLSARLAVDRQRATAEVERARQALAVAHERIQRLERTTETQRLHADDARRQVEAELLRQRADYVMLQRTVEESRAAAQTALDAAASELAAERTRLEELVAGRESELQTLAAAKEASERASARTLAELEARLRAELDELGRERDALRTEAARVPQLRDEIDLLRARHAREFEDVPAAMCRVGADGVVTHVNHALADLLGYDTPEALAGGDFAPRVFETAGDLQWLVSRCTASRDVESIDATWTRRDGRRLPVRVLAVATAPDSVVLAAEDLTPVRALEEKLRHSQRMESVARYASEIAVTCDSLLRHVGDEGQRWLARIDDEGVRYQGGLLLDEVSRATRFLRQLAVYGNEQKKVSELADVNTVLRDLAPVLKRVAGSNIEVVLPKVSTPLALDVEPERVERMLVNVAAYGRERMPLGGRLLIDIDSVVLDHEFVSKYPNVRPGAHVLLTVNEVRRAVAPALLAATDADAAGTTAAPADNPGVDLGTLQGLVNECGGHLWMAAQPPGDMVLKIHLPRRILDRPLVAIAKSAGRPRWMSRAAGIWH